MDCANCGSKNTTITKCNICPWYFCSNCIENELHNGDFICAHCLHRRCNTYKQTNGNCWMCDVKIMLADLESSPQISQTYGDFFDNLNGAIERLENN